VAEEGVVHSRMRFFLSLGLLIVAEFLVPRLLVGSIGRVTGWICYALVALLIYYRLAVVTPLGRSWRLLIAFGTSLLVFALFDWGPGQSREPGSSPSAYITVALALLVGSLPSRRMQSDAAVPARVATPVPAPGEAVSSSNSRLVGTARNVRRDEMQPSFFTMNFVTGGQTLRRSVLAFRLELTDANGDIVSSPSRNGG
jgi:hypothetical protein